MNRTNFEHALFALMMQLPFGLFGEWWMGAAFASAFLLGREHAQFEKHLTHGGDVNGLNPLAGFDIGHWSRDSRLDLLCPVLVVFLVAGARDCLRGNVVSFW